MRMFLLLILMMCIEPSMPLAAPMATTPGVAMDFPGVPDETERVNLIAYLNSLRDTPMPLP